MNQSAQFLATKTKFSEVKASMEFLIESHSLSICSNEIGAESAKIGTDAVVVAD